MDSGKIPVPYGLSDRRYSTGIGFSFPGNLETIIHSVQLHRFRFRVGNDPGDSLGVFLPGINPDRSALTVSRKTVSADGVRDGRDNLLEDSPGTNRFKTIF